VAAELHSCPALFRVAQSGDTTMRNAANLRIAAIFVILISLAVLFGASEALAGFTHFFNLAAVAIFAVASTLGLATRLRA